MQVHYDVLVTGGSRGIGAEIVKMYRGQGLSVLAPTRDEMDLSSRDSIKEFLDKYKDNHFSILINNAGCNDIHNVDEITDEEIDNMVNTNLLAPLLLTRGIVPGMKAEGFGRIINIGSIWGVVSKPGRTVYSMTKNGIHGLTVTNALELAKYGILVNTVIPGDTLTELTLKNNSPEDIKEKERIIPLGRLARPEEIAKIVCYFGSSENTYVTGQRIVVDGGYTVQ